MWELALPAAQLLVGAFQKIKSNRELKKLENEDISFKATPESRTIMGIAKADAAHGYNAAQKAAFLQNVASNTAKSYRLGMARAGNSLSNAIGASNNIANSQAMNQFAAQDAALQRSNQGVYNNLVAQDQQRANMNTQNELRNNQMAQQAYGMAGQQGTDNIMSALQMGSMVAGGLGKGGAPSGGAGNQMFSMQPFGAPVLPQQEQGGMGLEYKNPYTNNIPLTNMAAQQPNAPFGQIQKNNPYLGTSVNPQFRQVQPYNSFWTQFLNSINSTEQ